MRTKEEYINCKNCGKKFNGIKIKKSTRKIGDRIVPRIDYYLMKFCKDKCRKEYLIKINSGKNNPMYGKKGNSGKNNPMYGIIGKKNHLYGKSLSEEHKKKLSNTKKRLYKEGKIKVWSEGLTKETNSSLKKAGKKISKTKKRLIKEGKLVYPWKKNGRIIKGRYVYLRVPNHPKAVHGYVQEHRLVMENKIGRYLKSKEVIHHIDGDSHNNDINNLQLFKNAGVHQWVAHKDLHGGSHEKRINN